MTDVEKYRDRYLQAIKIEMANQGIENYKNFVDQLDLSYQTLSHIINKRQLPTTEQGIFLCKKFKISANWLFLGMGDPKLTGKKNSNQRQKTLDKIYALLKKL